MTKILDYTLANLKGTIYKQGEGYTYKIRKNKTIIGRSFVYFLRKEDCYERMISEMKILAEMNKDLFDLDKL